MKRFLVGLFFIFCLSAVSFAQGQLPDSGRTKGPEYVPGEVLVKFKEGADPQAVLKAAKLQPQGISRVHSIAPAVAKLKKDAKLEKDSDGWYWFLGKKYTETDASFEERVFQEAYKEMPPEEKVLYRTYQIKLAEGMNVEEVVDKLSGLPKVEYAQPNYILQAYNDYHEGNLPNDTYINPERKNGAWPNGAWGQNYEDLWGLKKIKAQEAWSLFAQHGPGYEFAGEYTSGPNTGKPVVVAVVDTGVDYNHPDLAQNIWVNPGEIPHNGIDDDGNGYVDDVYGFDFANNDADPMDDVGHGTHVSGTIAAVGNNNRGIIGVAPKAKIMAVKALGKEGGDTANLARAIIYAAQNKAKVINNSWGPMLRIPFNPDVEDAIKAAYAKGAVLVFAAGNANDDILFYSPQNMQETIKVAASDTSDEKALFSSFGALIDLAAPGGDSGFDDGSNFRGRNILSLRSGNNGRPINLYPGNDPCVVNKIYYRARGTSMAAPHVSGVAALIIALHPDFSNEQVRKVLRASADDIGGLGFNQKFGAGRLNAYEALKINIVPEAEISFPQAYAKLSFEDGTAQIRGKAKGESYQLSYSNCEQPGKWVKIGNLVPNPNLNGVLGTWNISRLETGNYLLRLTVTATGKAFQEVVPVTIEPRFSRISDSVYSQYLPRVWGDNIVWIDSRDRGSKAYLYNLSNQQEQRISSLESYVISLDIMENVIAWEDWRDVPPVIWNAPIPAKIYKYVLPDGPEEFVRMGVNPRFAGSPDNIVNGGLRVVGTPTNYATFNEYPPVIFRRDIEIITKECLPLVDNLYFYDRTNGAEARLTADLLGQNNPAAFQNRIVWSDFRARQRNPRGYYFASHIYKDEFSTPLILVSPERRLWVKPGFSNLVQVSTLFPEEGAVALSAQLSDGRPLSTIGAYFLDGNNNKGTFAWAPRQDQAGEQTIVFTARQGTQSVSRTVTFNVMPFSPFVFNPEPLPSNEQLELHEKYVFSFKVRSAKSITAQIDNRPLEEVRAALSTTVDKDSLIARFEWAPEAAEHLGRHLLTFTATCVIDGETRSETMPLQVNGVVVYSVNPSTVAAADTITISGHNFGVSQGDAQVVFFNNSSNNLGILRITEWSDTSITGILPDALPLGKIKLKVVSSTRESKENVELSVVPVIIRAVNPRVLNPGSEFTITGCGFGAAQGESKVNLGTAQLPVVSWSNTSITARVPGEISRDTFIFDLSVSTARGASNTLKVGIEEKLAPQITHYDVRRTTYWWESSFILTIYGRGLITREINEEDEVIPVLPQIEIDTDYTVNNSSAEVIALRLPSVTIGDRLTLKFSNEYGSSASVDILVASPPLLDYIGPGVVDSGVKVVIMGLNFGNSQGISRVLLNNGSLPDLIITDWWDYEIKGIIPEGVRRGEVTIKVTTVGGQSNELRVEVRQLPMISSIEPNEILRYRAGEISISGKNFGFTQGESRPLISGSLGSYDDLEIISWSDTLIKARLPAGIIDDLIALRILKSDGISDCAFLSIIYPQIQYVNDMGQYSAPPGGMIKIQGKGFGASPGQVIINDGQYPDLTVVSWSQDCILGRIPRGIPDLTAIRLKVNTDYGDTAIQPDTMNGTVRTDILAVYSVVPEIAGPNSIITIIGANLGNQIDNAIYIMFPHPEPNSYPLLIWSSNIISWSDTMISFALPNIIPQSGIAEIKVYPLTLGQNSSVSITLDNAAPATSINYSPAYVPGTWTKNPVMVNLTAADSGSGVKEILYSLDGSEPTIKYSKPIFLYRNGIYNLQYRAIDNAGNKEDTKSAEIKLDTQGILMSNLSVQFASKQVEFTVTAIDSQPGSGVKKLQLSVRAVIPDSRVQAGLRAVGSWKSFDLTQAQGDDVYKVRIPEEVLGPQGMAVFNITAEDNVNIRRAQITDNGVKSSSFLLTYNPTTGTVTYQRRY